LVVLVIGCEKAQRETEVSTNSPPPISGFSYEHGGGYVITPDGDIYYRSLFDDHKPQLIGNFWSGKAMKR
jgi:hypothetical protein